MSRTQAERRRMIRNAMWKEGTVEEAKRVQNAMFAKNRRINTMLKIDPIHGTDKVDARKRQRAQEINGWVENRELGLDQERTVEWEQDGFKLTARIEEDFDFGLRLDDDEALGGFSDYPEYDDPREYIKIDPTGSDRFDLERAGIIHHTYGMTDECPQYWTNGKTGTVAEQRAYYQHYGMSKGVAEEKARANQRMFYERALKVISGEIVGTGVVVTAERAGRVFATESLWGIESDAGSYYDEVASDLAHEAISVANEALDKLIENVNQLAKA